MARCEARIEGLRAQVFAADDGVVPARMRELEREWRVLSRTDPDAGLMDLWARIAPSAWIDHKRWRGSPPAAQLDAAIALASDVEGVEAAESAIASLGAALAAWSAPLGARVRWRAFTTDAAVVAALLAEPLRAAREALAAMGVEPIVVERARGLERDVHAAALARLPEHPRLAGDLAHAAFVDHVVSAASLPARPNPVASLRALWRTGYVLSSADDAGVTVELPPL